MSGLLECSACRRHTCCPLSPERKIRHFRLKGSFGQNTSFLVAEQRPTTDRAAWTYCRAPESCFARVRTRNQKQLRRAAIALTYSRLTTYGPCKPSYLIGPGDKVITVAPFYPVTPAISRGSNPMSPAGNAHGQPGASPTCCSAAWPFDENERGRTFVAQHR